MPSNKPAAAQIVYVTDSNLLNPTLLSAWCVLKHLSVPAELQIWGDRLTAEEQDTVTKTLKSANPKVTVSNVALDKGDLAGATSPAAHISAAAMGRLYIPSRMTGRVIYLDGDTLVKGDLAPLASVDMKGRLVGAVRDFVTSKQAATSAANKPRHVERLAELHNILGQDDVSVYFNSGVLLLDADAIREEDVVMSRLTDLERAAQHSWGDQDHLNEVFAGRVLLLNPGYNSSWGRTTNQRAFNKTNRASLEECRKSSEKVVHFHGPKKPWLKPRKDLWSTRARAVFGYRRTIRAFLKANPHIKW